MMSQSDNSSFNPLVISDSYQNDAIKRHIRNLLTSYNGWYDPFCEAIQNALDSVEQRSKLKTKDYQPSLWITINLKEDCLSVTDNGIGISRNDFERFLAPDVSLHTEKGHEGCRGYKGVGTTYLSYAFNYIQICSKTDNNQIIAEMVDARKWLYDSKADSPFPRVKIVNNTAKDKYFNDIDQGFSIFLKCDKETYPKDLSWIQVRDVKTWLDILLIKTGLGSIKRQDSIKVFIELINDNGVNSNHSIEGIEYLWIHKLPFDIKNIELSKIKEREQKLTNNREDYKDLKKYSSNLKGLDLIYDFYSQRSLTELIQNLEYQDDELKQRLLSICEKHDPYIYCSYVYSENFWNELHKNFTIRSSIKIFKSGIQLATDNMPQGEIIPIGYKSVNADRTNILIHFSDCDIDYGRKSFPKELGDFAQEITEILINHFSKYRVHLKQTSGKQRNLLRSEKTSRWKDSLEKYAENHPLELKGYNIPTLCEPAREQEVVALFNQFLGAKIIRSIEIISTDQNFTYDGAYRIKIDSTENYIYHEINNLLGLFKNEIIEGYKDLGLPFSSSVQVLEYKFSIDNLIEDLKDQVKNSNDINLLVVWETGNKWKSHYYIISCLDKDNIQERPYHGITHIMRNRSMDEEEMYLIVLNELIAFLNDPEKEQENQKIKYEE
jgi:hypothetical protein